MTLTLAQMGIIITKVEQLAELLNVSEERGFLVQFRSVRDVDECV